MASRRAAVRVLRLSPKLLEASVFCVGQAQVSYEIIQEQRRSARYSLTQRKAYLRVPFGITPAGLGECRSAFFSWLGDAVNRRPELEAAHTPRSFATGQVWRLGEHGFRITLIRGDLRGASAKTLGPARGAGLPAGVDTLDAQLKLGATLSPSAADELIEKLLYRLLARKLQASVATEVHEANRLHFQVPVTRVKLSATSSRWGSCSTTGTISLSTRLLGAPEFCRKAVIIHELAHGREMNHSNRFWGLVYGAMPDYDRADAWLRTEGRSLGWVLA